MRLHHSTGLITFLWVTTVYGHPQNTLPSDGITFSAIIQMLLALTLVILAIFASTWIIKRFNPSLRNRIRRNNGGMHILTSFSLGNREKMVIVNVHGQRLLIGITTHHISLIKDLTDVEDWPSPDTTTTTTTSSRLFQRLLKK